MYYALQNACATVTAIEDTPTTIYAIQNNNQIAPGTDKIGTVQAIRSRQLSGKIKLVAFDFSDIHVEALNDGTIDAMLVQIPSASGMRP